MERQELIRKMVLNEMCDDYENVDQIILPNVARECAKLGIVVERSDIVDALTTLVDEGLASAYLLTVTPPQEFAGMPPLDVVESVETSFSIYFYVTKKGREVHLADDSWWPFDDDGEPLTN